MQIREASKSFLKILRVSNTFSTRGAGLFYGAQLALWALAVILMSAHHQPWGDEVRALTIAIEPHWWWQLPTALRNEGHPVLWYLLLRFAYDIFRSPVVLKGVSIAVGFTASGLLLWRAPFPGWWKSCFIWSFLPLYEYSVIARNYGISMLLLFAFAAVYPLRKRQPYLPALMLALLANTNVHSLPLVVGLGAFWIWDEVSFRDRHEFTRTLGRLAVPVILVVLSALGAVLTCIPQKGYLPPGVSTPGLQGLLSALGTSLLHPGLTFKVLLPFPGVVRDLLVWGMVIGLISRPVLMVIFAFYPLVLQCLFLALYPGGLRHQGLLLMAAVTFYWLAREGGQVDWKSPRVMKVAVILQRIAVFGVLLGVLLTHIWLSRGPIELDWRLPFSSNEAFATLLRDDRGLKNAIIVPEPDNFLESLPYYADNRIFFARAGKFGKKVPYSESYRRSLTLGQLLVDAEGLKSRYKVPVLIVIGHAEWGTRESAVIHYHGKRTFAWDGRQLRAFNASTRLIARFDKALTNENYDVYLLVR